MNGQPVPILHFLRRLAAGRDAKPRDGDLLQRYLEAQDEAAFTVLVQRHGPMVLSVCRSVLRNRQDAEDAFQATFLVLAKKAASVRRWEAVASWLHGVAYRVALRARAALARRQAHEARAASPEPAPLADDLSWGEVRATLHAELAALPQRFREPLVLCYLQGLTHDEAARRLGWPDSTVKGRLQRGRALLRARLERRGLGLGAALGAAALAGPALASPLPRTLTAAAVRAALSLPGAAARVPALARGVLGHCALLKFGPVAAALLLTLALVAGSLPRQAPAGGRPAPDAGPAPVDPAPAADPADRHGDPLPDGAVARLGTLRFNHGEGLRSLHFSPDSKTILSEGDGSLRLWDAATGKELKHFTTALKSFDVQAHLTPDGKTLVALDQGSHDTLHFWDLAQGKETRAIKLPQRRNFQSVYLRNALAPDGRLCALNTREEVRVFEVETGKELCRLAEKVKEGRAVAFAGPDRLVTAERKGLVKVWEARTGKLVRQLALGGPAELLAASADGRRLAALKRQYVPFKAPDGRVLSVHDHDVIQVWDLATGTKARELASRSRVWHLQLRFAPDGKLLFAAGIDEEGGDGWALAVWDADTGRRVRELRSSGGRALAVSRDGSRLATGDVSKFDLWDLKTGRRLSPEGGYGWHQTVALSPSGDRVFAYGATSVITWDGTTGRRLGSFAVPPYPYSDPERSQLFSRDGRLAVTLAENKLHLEILVWDVAGRRRLHTLRPPDSALRVTRAEQNVTRVYEPPGVHCALAHDSSLLATCHPGKETVIRLWDLRTGKEVRSFKASSAGWIAELAFARDGKTLFAAGHRTVGFEVATGKESFSWRLKPLPNTSGGGIVVGGRMLTEDDQVAWRALAVSPDGARVACILTAGGFAHEKVADRVALCDARTGKFLRRWGDSGEPQPWRERLAFSPNGKLLASSDGAAVHVWEVATGKAVRTFRGHRGQIQALAFSANGRRLASGSSDSTVVLWDLRRPSGPRGGKGGGAPGG
jgi:RNA polymerase sigma factor (sigma-70 family)